ncbi:MAG TPA: LamG-like jellyroll fold domain-containing protein [Verrucomicrobiae bacterium]|nr:LamG-like jellyroll fold domain-containing protein [Verrucomicrobiae bacterium]
MKTSMLRNLLTGASVGLSLLAFTPVAKSATFQWTNTTSGAFTDASNWTNTASPFGNGVPATGDNAVNNIAGSTTLISDGDFVAVNNLQPNEGALSMTGGEITVNALQLIGPGSITISGGTVTAAVDTRIQGGGTWTINGGTLNLPKMVVGAQSGAGNQLIVSGSAYVNQNQSGGGSALWVGGNNGGSGSMVLRDNAIWINSNASLNGGDANPIVVIGNTGSGQGTFTIQDNATFSYQNVLRLGRNAGNTGTLNLNGGTMTVRGIERQSGAASVNANGGTLQAVAATTNFFINLTNAVNLAEGGLRFDTAGFPVRFNNAFGGVGGLTKLGPETLTLAAANSYSGPTVVDSGTLALVGAGAISSSSAIAVNAFSTLDLAGLAAPFVVPGTLTLNDGTLNADFTSTNITVGTFGTAGSVNTINITGLPPVTSIPARITLIKYSSAAPGLVDGDNHFTALTANYPTTGSPVAHLTNNVANKSIDLVITSMILAPVITRDPQPDSAYPGFAAHFSVELESTNSPAYQWRRNGTPLSDGGTISGANEAVLVLNNVTAADLGNYDVVVTNASGMDISAIAALTLRSPTGFEAAAVSEDPTALYLFNETSDPTSGTAVAHDYAGDHDGLYGVTAQNGLHGIAGPVPALGFPGFEDSNTSLRVSGFTPDSHVVIPPLNLHTNTVTFAAWIKPGLPPANAGLIFSRSSGTTAGFNFTGSADANGQRTLGYTWNNEGGTFNWNSQIAPPSEIWSFVALVITPTNATVYVFNANGLLASSQNYNHVVQGFAGNTYIGEDPFSGGNRQFDGSIDSMAIYRKALTQDELTALYAAGSGISTFAPTIFAQPATQSVYEQQTVRLSVGASGSLPLAYQWQRFDGVNFVDVSNGGRFSGATGPSLTISNITPADAGDYVLVVTNLHGPAISQPATISVNPVSAAEEITNSVVQPGGQDWNTGSAWSDGLAANVSAVSKPGSTYHVVVGGGLRTPNTTASVTFPGEVLTIYGSGVFDSTHAGIASLILKGRGAGETVFPRLVMNGGQILSFTDNNDPTSLGGEIEIAANTPISGSTTSGGRSITINAKLTGSATIEYRGFQNATFQPNANTALNVAGAVNTFSGTWNVLGGTLVGSAAGSLGTNSIIVETNAALQASYDINSPAATLTLNGRFNLTRNHTFGSVTAGGIVLAAGTYTAAQLTAAYPNHFPATWTGVTGATAETSATGSLTVIGGGTAATPANLTMSFGGGALSLSWPQTHQGWVLQVQTNSLATGLASNWTDVPASASMTSTNIPATPGNPAVFYRLRRP